MNRTLACSATLAASLMLTVVGCGGGGGGGQGETPKPPAAVTPTTAPAAAGGPTPTLAGGGTEENAPLLAWADAEPEDGKAPLEVQFKADTEGGKAPLKYTWKFGDGSPDSADPNPKHTYDKPGKYRADLNVSDSAGDTDSDYVEIEVQ